MVKVTLVEGKSVGYTGPYSLASRLPIAWAKRLVERVRRATNPSAHLFSMETQQVLSRYFAEQKDDLSLRSIRKGAIVYASQQGVNFPDLMIHSGHKNANTLRRYLGWGVNDEEIVAAANKRAAKEESPVGSGYSPANATNFHPMWTGLRPGFGGVQGRRRKATEDDVPFFPSKAPSRREMGLEEKHVPKRGSLPLHIKDVGPLSIRKLIEITRSPQLREQLKRVLEWTETSEHFGISWPRLSPQQIPELKFSYAQVDRAERNMERSLAGPRGGDTTIQHDHI